MIGIRTSITKVYQQQQVSSDSDNENVNALQPFDFDITCTYDLIQKRSAKFDKTQAAIFVDYAPNVFGNIRKLYGISDVEYLRSVGPE